MFKIEEIRLLSGSHSHTAKTGSGCIMNVVAYLNGESRISDRPEGVCPIIRSVAIWLNDTMEDNERYKLMPFVSRIIGCRTDDRAKMWRRVNVLADKLATLVGGRPNLGNSVMWSCDRMMSMLSTSWHNNCTVAFQRETIRLLMEALDEMLPNPEKQKSPVPRCMNEPTVVYADPAWPKDLEFLKTQQDGLKPAKLPSPYPALMTA